MLIAATTPFDGEKGETYVYSVSAHNGHTTSIEIQDDQDNWNVLTDAAAASTYTAFHYGEFVMPMNSQFRLVIASGTGSISFHFTRKKKLTN